MGLGFNTVAQMLGSTAIIGVPGSTVKQYNLESKTLAGVDEEASPQLFNASIVSGGGRTVMRFSRPLLAPPEGPGRRRLSTVAINPIGDTKIVWAYGSGSSLACVGDLAACSRAALIPVVTLFVWV